MAGEQNGFGGVGAISKRELCSDFHRGKHGPIRCRHIYIFAGNIAGTASNFTNAQLGFATIGGGFTSAQASSFYSRMHTYLSAVGAPGGC
jgi:hypothetical protein